ncbi:programmed cell death 1 ligand 1-like [Sander lucioperca]|uniref:programmed cell death 1 ligand 1-like n=1 Tax=Sander lucioperca TaxID=283035 RepID=UPI001653BADD|nr:programmed cell death 1 ligand 1-like [Sander lucioperca]
MILLIILLLIILTSCVSGRFVVNVTQTSYQAEENHNITLEWTFTTNPHSSSNSLNIFCELITVLKNPGLFHLHEGVEVPESQHDQFAGRVQWDKDVLREGRLRLHVSRLRTEDSGLYKCDVLTSYGRSSGKCWLNVTAWTTETPWYPKILQTPDPNGESAVKGENTDRLREDGRKTLSEDAESCLLDHMLLSRFDSFTIHRRRLDFHLLRF